MTEQFLGYMHVPRSIIVWKRTTVIVRQFAEGYIIFNQTSYNV